MTVATLSFCGVRDDIPQGSLVVAKSGSSIEIWDVHSGSKSTISTSVSGGESRISGDGTRIVTGNGNKIEVFDRVSGNKLLTKTQSTPSGNGPGFDISWTGDSIFFINNYAIKMFTVSGNGNDTKTIYTIDKTTSGLNNKIDGEFGVSKNGNRFVFRGNTASDAFCVDVSRNTLTKYASHCSGGISPSGTKLAVNEGDHYGAEVYSWPLNRNSPNSAKESISIKSCNGNNRWDNHHWSNDDRYYIGHQDGTTILDVDSKNCWRPGNFSTYPDLWVKVEATPTAWTVHTEILATTTRLSQTSSSIDIAVTNNRPHTIQLLTLTGKQLARVTGAGARDYAFAKQSLPTGAVIVRVSCGGDELNRQVVLYYYLGN